MMVGVTGFFYARPSFLGGMARALDLGDTLTEYNQSLTPEQADDLALAADWQAVGQDLRLAMENFAHEHPELQRDVPQEP